MPPPAALSSTVNAPFAALVVASKVSNEVPGGVSVCGENEAVTPDGKFVADSVTALLKPSSGLNETTKDALCPGTRVSELGSRLKEKFGCAVALWTKPRASKTIKSTVLCKRNIFMERLLRLGATL